MVAMVAGTNQGCRQQIKAINILVGIEEGLTNSTVTWEAVDSWWGVWLGFLKDVAPGRFTRLQWMVIKIWIAQIQPGGLIKKKKQEHKVGSEWAVDLGRVEGGAGSGYNRNTSYACMECSKKLIKVFLFFFNFYIPIKVSCTSLLPSSSPLPVTPPLLLHCLRIQASLPWRSFSHGTSSCCETRYLF